MARYREVRVLARDRVDRLLSLVVDGRTVLLTAPAGAGKTTAVADWLGRSGTEAVWVNTDVSHATPQAFVAAVASSAGHRPDAASLADVFASLAGRLVVLDDVHTIRGTPAEAELGRVVGEGTRAVGLVLLSREMPGFDLSRPRVAGWLVELDADDLRFRSWETERLFREVYGESLPPTELAELTRRTEGWAAGLQLFHLATRGKPPTERRRVLGAMTPKLRFVREYLAANVLATLSPVLREFLLDTCVLGVLTGPLCDALRGKEGSDALLAELEQKSVFTVRVDENVWRYHEVLRTHLELTLVEEVGEPDARRRHARAGRLLEHAGATVDALRAYARAGDEDAVARLLRAHGAEVASAPGAWIDALPEALRENDAWLLLAAARRYVALGRWRAAIESYTRAWERFGKAGGAETCVRERRRLAQWLEPVAASPDSAYGLVRAATQLAPLAHLARAAALPAPAALVAGATITLLAGHVPATITLGEHARRHPDADAPVIATSDFLLALAAFLAGGEDLTMFEEAADSCEAAGLVWIAALARVGRAAYGGEAPEELLAVRRRFLDDGNPFAAGLAALMIGFASLRRSSPPPRVVAAAVADAAVAFDRLNAGVLAGWCAALGAAIAGARSDPTGAAQATAARSQLRRLAVPGPLALVYACLTGEGHREADRGLAAPVAARFGIAVPASPPVSLPTSALESWMEAADRQAADGLARLGLDLPSVEVAQQDLVVAGRNCAVSVRCLGRFALRVRERDVDLSELRPRARSLLRLLAVHAGQSVHREALVEALWPGVSPERGLRSLHVALSSLRSILAAYGARDLLVREGEAYRLALPPDADVDWWRLDELLETVRRATRRADLSAALEACEQAFGAYAGPLVPEEGPAEWVVGIRDRLAGELVDAAHPVTDLLLTRGQPHAAAALARRALAVDGLRSALWDVLADAHEAAGELRAAARARADRRAAVDEPLTVRHRTPAR